VLGTRRLLGLAREEHIKHVVYVSIVGIDRSAYRYHRTKLKTEAVVREDIVPWTILRATQFHDLVEIVLHGFSRCLPSSLSHSTGRFSPSTRKRSPTSSST